MRLFTIHCPKCKVLETKLKQKNIDYEEILDEEIIKKEGIDELPILELDDGTRLSFIEANKYVNSLASVSIEVK